MIKKLSKPEAPIYRKKSSWPENPDDLPALFLKRQPLRKMRVLIDASLLSRRSFQGVKLTKQMVLESLLSHELVQFYKYSDEGPSPSASTLKLHTSYQLSHPVYPGWAVMYAKEDGFWPVTYAEDEDSYSVSAVSASAPQFARDHVTIPSEETIAPEVREKDCLALHVASEAVQADLYITERPFLHAGGKFASEPGVTVCNVEEAITLISLFLRVQNVFTVPTGSSLLKMNLNKGLYYWVGTRELLPEGWRWFSACVQHSSQNEDRKLLLLGGSALSRVNRALEARDEVHSNLNMPANNDTSDDALSNLDSVLTLLMGALDAAARVAHVVLKLPENEHKAAWQSKTWLGTVARHCPQLAKIVKVGTKGRHALTILRLLRNSVHGIALQGIQLHSDGKQEILIGLPEDDEAAILQAMDALGGREKWGFRPLHPTTTHIDPAIFVDKLFEEVKDLLNMIMAETPVELLPGVTITPENSKPPEESNNGMPGVFTKMYRDSIRWQLGF